MKKANKNEKILECGNFTCCRQYMLKHKTKMANVFYLPTWFENLKKSIHCNCYLCLILFVSNVTGQWTRHNGQLRGQLFLPGGSRAKYCPDQDHLRGQHRSVVSSPGLLLGGDVWSATTGGPDGSRADPKINTGRLSGNRHRRASDLLWC